MRTLVSSRFTRSLALLFAIACDDGLTPPQPREPAYFPPPQFSGDGYVWGHVVAPSGVCIQGVEVKIVSGPGLGRKVIQNEPCNAWSYGPGFEFPGLPLGERIKLQASLTGYRTQEKELLVSSGGPPVIIELVRE